MRRVTHSTRILVVAALVVGLAGCGGGSKKSTSAPTATTTPAAARAATDEWGTKWVCKPGLPDNPCLADQSATAILPGGKLVVSHSSSAKRAPVDCFYVYPTISG